MSKYFILLIPTFLFLMVCFVMDIFVANVATKIRRNPGDETLVAKREFYARFSKRMKVGTVGMFIFFCCLFYFFPN